MTEQNNQNPRLVICLVSAVCLMPIATFAGIHWFLPHVDKSKLVSAPQVHRGLSQEEVKNHLRNHTILHIGGLHRTGTTTLWEGLGRHPDVSDLQRQNHTDPRVKASKRGQQNWNEGLFLQDVYPKFGLDHDKILVRKWVGQLAKKIPFVDEKVFSWVRLREGVGRFALNPENHLDETSPLMNEFSQFKLFNQWALFWDLNKPKLVEKSPSNSLISPFLHRLWGLGMDKSPAQFVFMRRHPIAVALSIMSNGGMLINDLSVFDLVENWVLAEERLVRDIQQYFEMGTGHHTDAGSTYRIIRLEVMAQEPRKVLEELLTWMGLAPNEDAVAAFVSSTQRDPNAKHFSRYCAAMHKRSVTDELIRIVERFGQRIKAIEPAYDLHALPDVCKEILFAGRKQLGESSRGEEL